MCYSICDYSFFSPHFSPERKVAAAVVLAIGIALTIIFALGLANIIPAINAKYPIIGLTFGTLAFLIGGIALAGINPPKHPAIRLAEALQR